MARPPVTPRAARAFGTRLRRPPATLVHAWCTHRRIDKLNSSTLVRLRRNVCAGRPLMMMRPGNVRAALLVEVVDS